MRVDKGSLIDVYITPLNRTYIIIMYTLYNTIIL